MARPQKNGLDYMSLDIDVFSSITFRYISARYNSPGIIVCIRLLTEIYRKGYYLTWDNITKYTLVDALPKDCDAALVDSVIRDLMELDFFDRTLFETEKVLTSRNIQSRYFEAKEKKKIIFTELKYLLIKDKNENESTEITPVNSEKNPVNSELTPQKKRKENQRIIPPYSPPQGGERVFSELIPEEKPQKATLTPELKEYNEAVADKGNIKYNYHGLVDALKQLHASNAEIGIIAAYSHYGMINHPVWTMLNASRAPNIQNKVRYIISSLEKLKRQSNTT